MDERSSSESSDDSSRPSSGLSTISEHTEPDLELKNAMSQDISELPEVFETTTDFLHNGGDNNNNGNTNVALQSEHESLIQQFANITIRNVTFSSHAMVFSSSSSSVCTSESEAINDNDEEFVNDSQSTAFKSTDIPIETNESKQTENNASPSDSESQVVAPRVHGPVPSILVEVINPNQVGSSDEESDSPPPSPRRLRVMRKRQRQKGFDCYFLPDHRWKFGYRLVRGCRHWINHHRMTVTHSISDEEWNLDFQEYYFRHVKPRIPFGPAPDGPFDMFSNVIMRNAVSYTFFRLAIQMMVLIQQYAQSTIMYTFYRVKYLIISCFHIDGLVAIQTLYSKIEKLAKLYERFLKHEENLKKKMKKNKKSKSIE